MPDAPRLSIIVAVKEGASNLPALLEKLNDPADAEVILSCAGHAPNVEPRHSVTVVCLPDETLIPSLWSEGIMRARGSRVVLTTAQFVPRSDWLNRLHDADLDDWVGVGGAIENDPASSARNWAIFFLRYSAFAPPLRAGETEEIAADNAIYDLAAVLDHPDLLQVGFWEPSFHRRFRAAGRKLMLDPQLVVIHHGTVPSHSFARQRYLHGRAYGAERADRGSLARNLLLLLSSPLVAPLLLARIVSRMAKQPRYRAKLVTAFPWLLRFTLAWAAGEAGGYASSLTGRRQGTLAAQSKRHA